MTSTGCLSRPAGSQMICRQHDVDSFKTVMRFADKHIALLAQEMTADNPHHRHASQVAASMLSECRQMSACLRVKASLCWLGPLT